jgi:hypothetical protein
MCILLQSGTFLSRLHENLENEVMAFCLVGQVIDTNPNDFELWVVYKRSGTREMALQAVNCVICTI